MKKTIDAAKSIFAGLAIAVIIAMIGMGTTLHLVGEFHKLAWLLITTGIIAPFLVGPIIVKWLNASTTETQVTLDLGVRRFEITRIHYSGPNNRVDPGTQLHELRERIDYLIKKSGPDWIPENINIFNCGQDLAASIIWRQSTIKKPA